jgi:hypothetical protein
MERMFFFFYFCIFGNDEKLVNNNDIGESTVNFLKSVIFFLSNSIASASPSLKFSFKRFERMLGFVEICNSPSDALNSSKINTLFPTTDQIKNNLINIVKQSKPPTVVESPTSTPRQNKRENVNEGNKSVPVSPSQNDSAPPISVSSPSASKVNSSSESHSVIHNFVQNNPQASTLSPVVASLVCFFFKWHNDFQRD